MIEIVKERKGRGVVNNNKNNNKVYTMEYDYTKYTYLQ